MGLAAHDGQLVVVVSAMSGVTNCLIKAAQASATGDMRVPAELAEDLRTQHHSAIAVLVGNDSTREQLTVELDKLIDEVADLCRGTALLRELTPRALDSISSAGERLPARLPAQAICELDIKRVRVESTELIVSDH